MISSLVYCLADADGTIPQSSGYQLLAALSRFFTQRLSLNMFHSVSNRKKDFTISSLYPAAFWNNYFSASRDGYFPVCRDAMFAFRICFFDDATFNTFCAIENARIELNHIPFDILRVMKPDKGLNRHSLPQDLQNEPTARGAEFRFISPTGFATEKDIQYLFPDPERVFSNLYRRWEELFGRLPGEVDYDAFTPVNVRAYNLKSATATLKAGSYKRGFMGTVSYGWEKLDKERQRTLSILSAFALYAGVGYKTSMGLGQVVTELKFAH